MMRNTKRAFTLILTAALLLAPLGALADTWSAPFSPDAVQPVSPAESESMIAFLNETSMGLDPDETDYTYAYSIEGQILLNGRSWYLGRWTQVFDDGHQSLMTDFLLDPDTLEMYPCIYPDAQTIEWSDGMEPEMEPEDEIIGEAMQLCPYMSARGFSMAYDAACLAPAEGREDCFTGITGEAGVSVQIAVVEALRPDDFGAFLIEAVNGGEALYTQLDRGDGVQIRAAAVSRNGEAYHYYLVSFGNGALAITCQAPLEADGVWGARFDALAASVTY